MISKIGSIDWKTVSIDPRSAELLTTVARFDENCIVSFAHRQHSTDSRDNGVATFLGLQFLFFLCARTCPDSLGERLNIDETSSAIDCRFRTSALRLTEVVQTST